jgi:hypothetical protein
MGENPVSENIFRPVYRELTEDEKIRINVIKDKAQELYSLFPKTDDLRGINREVSLGMTALEESIMWVVKGMTK